MVISDEKIDAILETMRTTMEQFCIVQKENSDLNKELIAMLKQGGRFPPESPGGPSVKQEDEGDYRRRIYRPKPIPIRPIIEEGVDDFGWNLFLDKWDRYKVTVGLEDERETCSELRESCSPV